MSSAELTFAVSSIQSAFRAALDIFHKIRVRQRTAGQAGAKLDEIRLLKSLKASPFDLQAEYDRGLARFGWRFEVGDATTINLLTRTLVKLNSGLIDTISLYLSKKKRATRPDYGSLTNLSDACRAESLYSLAQLQWRLSQQPSAGYVNCSQCRGAVACICPRKAFSDRKSKPARKVIAKSDEAIIARVPVKCSEQTQLAIVRPKPKARREGSSSSTNSSTSRVPAPTHFGTTSTSLIVPSPSFAPHPSTHGLARQGNSQMVIQGGEQYRLSANQRPKRRQIPTCQIDRSQAAATSLPFRRRQAKLTPSVYTFKSDSTKIGEIPMNKWIEPFDFDAMQRVNAWAELQQAAEIPPELQAVARPGLLSRMFRKGGHRAHAGA